MNLSCSRFYLTYKASKICGNGSNQLPGFSEEAGDLRPTDPWGDRLAIFKSSARIEALTGEKGMTQEDLLALIEQAADEEWKELDLSGKELTELPAEIGKLTQLETLILGKVQKGKMEWVDGEVVPAVITNQLTTLPRELSVLKNLRSLDLSGNPLTVIPCAGTPETNLFNASPRWLIRNSRFDRSIVKSDHP